MARRFVAALVVAAFVVTLLLPVPGVAADEPAGDAVLVGGDGTDALTVERLRPTVATPGHARGEDRTAVRGEGDRESAAGDRALEQPTRAAVYQAVRDSPGQTLSGVAEAVGVTKSTVRYHVRVLREAGLVDAMEASGALRVAPADADVVLAASLNAEGTGAVLDAVAEREPASVTELARATDRAPSTVSHHLSALEDRGLVERERVGEAVVTTLAPATRTKLTAGGAAPADD